MKAIYICAVAAMSFIAAPNRHIKVWLVGDSTMANKETKTYPETGWGMPFTWFFDSTVTVDNRAKNGRSTKSFLSEHLWQPIVSQLQEGDYVFIQFGHNDEVPTKATYATEDEFRANLTRYVQESRDKKAIPVLLTPVARRKFDSLGNVVGTHDVYAAIVRSVANENKVPLIDLDKEGQQLYQQWGVEKSKLLFNYVLPGEHPNYPEGKEDNTHFSELGARKIAEMVLADVRALHLELAGRIIAPALKK